MNFDTKNKKLEENLFADMIVLVGTFMEYGNIHSVFNKEDFMKYYDERKDFVNGRCRVQKYVIKQAKKFYEEKGEPKNITYSKVKRIYRRNILWSYRIRSEQYYFWKFVMDYIMDNDILLDIFLERVMKKCDYYDSIENAILPYIDCMHRMLDWYYVRINMNNRIFWFGNGSREKMISMFYTYERFPKYKETCRSYMENK